MKVKGGMKRRNLGEGTDGGGESGEVGEGVSVDGDATGDVGYVGNGEEMGLSGDGEDGVGGGEEEVGNGGEQRPKLAEGFYEIEAVRRRRVRKGEVQYLIKWRGWPESENTWEPLENLSSCVDIVEAFEENIQSGKTRSSRKRKRITRPPQVQHKKEHQSESSQSASTSHDSGQIENDVINKIPSCPKKSTVIEDAIPLQTVRFGLKEVTESDSRDFVSKQSAKKVTRNSSESFSFRDEESGYDPKLSELRGGGAYCNGFTKAYSTLTIREVKGSGDNEPRRTIKVDSEPGHNVFQVGARKRKCNVAKRFKQETAANSLVAQNEISTAAYTMNLETCNVKSSPIITKITKPIGFSASIANNIQDVSVTFMAMRSDGKEVMVDNNFLKANYPLLLIDFYEQHLRYSPTS